MLSLAPSVSAARTAIPSIAAVSNGGEERAAQIGSAVTRPTASSSATTIAGTRDAHRRAAGLASTLARVGEREVLQKRAWGPCP